MHMKTNESVNLRSVAAEVYDKCGGDAKRSRTTLAKRLLREREFLGGIVGEIAHEAIRRHIHRVRHEIWGGSQHPKPEPESAKDAEIQAANERISRWYSMPLSTGKHLGEAVRGEVVLEADMHRTLSASNGIKARFYKALSAKLPDELSTVSSVLSEDEIEEIARGES